MLSLSKVTRTIVNKTSTTAKRHEMQIATPITSLSLFVSKNMTVPFRAFSNDKTKYQALQTIKQKKQINKMIKLKKQFQI